jgi:hypothetical protein
VLCSHSLYCGLLDYDQRKIDTCWRNVLVIKLNIDIVRLVVCNKTVYQIMHGMNNNDGMKHMK